MVLTGSLVTTRFPQKSESYRYELAGVGSVDLTVGTPCNGNTQTVTAWVGASTARVSKRYDQTNGNHCGGSSCDLIQASSSSQPIFLLTGCGGSGTLPCLYDDNNGPPKSMASANNFTPNAGAKVSFSVIANRTLLPIAQAVSFTSNNGVNIFGANGNANNWVLIGAASNFTASAADATFHAGNAVIGNASNTSAINIDGTETLLGVGTQAGSTAAGPPSITLAGTFTKGYIGEDGFADNVAWSSGTRTALCHNMRLYWGTGGSC